MATTPTLKNKSNLDLALEVILGRDINGASRGSGEVRKQLLGDHYAQVQELVNDLLSNHDELIRSLAQYVLDDKAGSGEVRKKYLGKYYDEVQKKVTWVIQAAEDVWSGKYGSGDERRKALGDDYDIVQARVSATAPQRFVFPNNIGKSVKTDMSGKRYNLMLPTKKGRLNFHWFGQHKQGISKISGSGCSMCATLAIVSTFKDSSVMPVPFYNSKLGAICGSQRLPVSPWGAKTILSKYRIDCDWVSYFKDTNSAMKDIEAHLRSGQPVLVWVVAWARGKKTYDKIYTSYVHTVVLAGFTENGKVLILDSGGKGPYRIRDFREVCDHIQSCSFDYDKATATQKSHMRQMSWYNLQHSSGYLKVKL